MIISYNFDFQLLMALNKISISKSYSSSFFEYVICGKLNPESLYKELEYFCHLIDSCNILKLLIINKDISKKIKLEAWNKILKNINLSKLAGNFIKLLLINSRSFLIKEITRDFYLLWLKYNKITLVNVKLNEIPDEVQLIKLQKDIKEIMPFKIIINLEEDSSIIGGIIISWDSYICDLSIKNRLKKVYRFLSSDIIC